ncbi:FGGY family carbohydrate kinase, partial [Enterococcus hirae]|uniref:FGGY family carbohydrate kinase n=1 Tax=Enterococcus hirae TaxID=1354 RepID=UPI001E3CC797
MSTILAFDLGATSARGIVFSLMNGQIKEEKVYRFTDYQVIDPNKDEIHWNIEKIMTNIKEIITLATTEYVIESIGIDTWGCDFGLIDKKGQLVLPPLCYQTMLKEPNLHYGGDLPTHFHERTGIPNASINTSSQLLYLKEHYPEQLNKASTLLMMPDLIHFLLTGTILTESSIASTSQLFDIDKHQWASDLIEQLGISPSLFSTIVLPYTKIGLINLAEKQLPIHSVMSHDTASAIFALPTNDHSCFFLSSGTWSVLGEKSERGILVNHPLDTNYSYEQAGDGKILKLKNMLGMWFIEEALAFSNQTQSITIQQIQDMLLTAKSDRSHVVL